MPTTEIVKSEPDSQESILSEGQRRARYRQALRDIKSGILFGYKADLLKAASLADIHHHKLYEIDGMNWTKFLETIDISKSHAHRLVACGEMIREGVRRVNGLKEAPTMLTQKAVFASLDKLITDGSRDISVRDLAKASKDYETFAAYLSGSGEEEPARKLLEDANKSSLKALNAHKDEPNQFQQIAESKGYKFNVALHRYENPDGSELSRKQECEFLTPSGAMRTVQNIEDALLAARRALESANKTNESFWIYRVHGNDNKFHTDVQSKFLGIRL